MNLRHPGVIRICFRRHVASFGSRVADHLEHPGRFGQAGAVDMHHVQGSTGLRSERQRLLEAVDARANVHVDRSLRLPGDAEQDEQLGACRGGRVRESGADVDRALAQAGVDASSDLINLVGRCRAIGAVAHRHDRTGIVHHRHSDFDMADADAVVDQLAGIALAIPGRDVGRPQLQLQCSRHAVERVEAVGLCRLSVGVQVDEPRGDDEAARIDRVPADDRVRRDDGDASVLEPDVPDGVEPRGGIHHAAAEDHAVVDGRRGDHEE